MSMREYREKLTIEARRVRAFLESRNSMTDNLFSRFPCGACGNSTDLLGKWLCELGMNDVEYVSGFRKKSSHAWIECNSFLIDITSDQFQDGLGDVYVGPTNDFHRSFSNQRRSVPELSRMLLEIYSEMRETLTSQGR